MIQTTVNIGTNYEADPSEIRKDIFSVRVIFHKGRARRSYDQIYYIQAKYYYMVNDEKFEIDDFIHNNGFDCNYKKEWKTLKGAVRFFEKKYGKILL